MSDSPILFIIFNRPDTSQKVFEAIRNAKPSKLYVSADAARNNNSDDKEKCKQVRSLVNEIDWECEVKTLFQEKNLGCRLGVQTALNWFFDHEEMGIILEDDCVPVKSFFPFCSEMLIKFKDDKRIVSINGCNLGYNLNNGDSYTFSRFMNMWGWGTWRRCAEKIDYNLSDWKKEKHPMHTMYKRLRQNIFDTDIYWYKYWKYRFDCIIFNNTDTWDWQWIFYQIKNKKFSVVPKVNLVSNIGFNEDGTHTRQANNPAAGLKTHSINFPLKHPASMKVDIKYEEENVKWIWCYQKRLPKIFYLKSLISKMINHKYS